MKVRFHLWIAIALLAAGSPASASRQQTPPSSPTARDLFFAAETSRRSPSAAKPSAAPGLRYRLVQKADDNREIDADPATTFKSGDSLKFIFESNVDGYLYVAQQGSSGRWTMLFPHPDINAGRNAIRRSERYAVPPDGWFQFDSTPGTEQMFVFLSVVPLRQLPGFDGPVTRVEAVAPAVVEDLKRTIKSRDLVFQKDRAPGTNQAQMNYVVNRAELGKSVTAVITLTHAK